MAALTTASATLVPAFTADAGTTIIFTTTQRFGTWAVIFITSTTSVWTFTTTSASAITDTAEPTRAQRLRKKQLRANGISAQSPLKINTSRLPARTRSLGHL